MALFHADFDVAVGSDLRAFVGPKGADPAGQATLVFCVAATLPKISGALLTIRQPRL